jgi:excisionase family DNA binding protein
VGAVRHPYNPPRLAVSKAEAADQLGVNVKSFERHIEPHLRSVRVGRRRLYPLAELNRWLEREGAIPLARDGRPS